MYAKIIKYISLALLVIGAGLTVWGYIAGFTSEGAEVDTLLYWAYGMVFAGIATAVIGSLFASIANNPKSLIKLLGGLVVCAVIVGAAYMLASGDPLVNHMGAAPSEATLKLTDTIMNLVYFTGVLALGSILFGVVYEAINGRK